MKTLYIDCPMGAAGDMLTAALTELLPDKKQFFDLYEHACIPGITALCSQAESYGITGTDFSVIPLDVPSQNGSRDILQPFHCSTLGDVTNLVSTLQLPGRVKSDICAVYRILAEAESYIHGVSAERVHFHEIGRSEAVACVTAVCVLMYLLAPDAVVVSPVHVGSGYVHCSHGTLPVPAPATALILNDIPTYGGSVVGELCTPTAAALLKHFAHHFCQLPDCSGFCSGYGIGKRDFGQASYIRVLLSNP